MANNKKQFEFLKSIDLFGSEIKLNIGGNEKIHSQFGAILSIFTYLIYLGIIIFNILDFFKDNDYQVIESSRLIDKSNISIEDLKFVFVYFTI